MYFLETERLGFRAWRAEDEELAVALWTDPQVTQFIRAGGAASREAAVERLALEMSLEQEHGVSYWPIFLRASGEHVGCCGLRPRRELLELGFHLRPAHWGRGLAREAATAVIAHAFGPLGLRSLFAGHHPDHVASRHLLTTLGFRHTHDELFPPTGLMHLAYLLER